MEEKVTGASSERDKSMMSSFERFKDDKENKKNKKKAKTLSLSKVFEAARDDEKVEKRGNIFDDKKPEKATKLFEPEEDGSTAEEKFDADEIEQLTDDELKFAAHKIVEAEKESLKEDLAEADADSPEEAQALAKAALIEVINDKVENNEVIDDVLLDEALSETVKELDIEQPETEVNEDVPHETTEEDEDADPIIANTSSTTGPPTPPLPPAPPTGGSGMMPPSFGVPHLPSSNPNTLPAASPNVLPSPHNRAGDVLVGGIIGYFIGRRRGRIKTEARLLPIQKKLERQVTDLRQKIYDREEKISNLVAKKIENAPKDKQTAVSEQLITRIEQKATRREQALESWDEKMQVSEQVLPRGVERLGRTILPKPAIESEPTRRDIAELSVPDLLEIASQLKVEGVTIKNMYETGRLDAVGLRRVVGEYLRGERYERVLHENLKSEQSPEFIMSQLGAAGQINSGRAQGGTATYSPKDNQAISGYKAQVEQSLTPEQLSQQQTEKPQPRQAAIIVGATTAIILLLVWLLFLR